MCADDVVCSSLGYDLLFIIFQLCKELIPSASNVWFHPVHVFIATNNFHKLTTFDIKPYETSNGDTNQKCLDLFFDLSPLHDVLFGISDADSCLVFLVSVIKGYHL
jgi:hypothetical protein